MILKFYYMHKHIFMYNLKDRISGGFKILISEIIAEYIYGILDSNRSCILYNFNTSIISEESCLWGDISRRD